ncbi:MAG TPA: hypothetical protein VLA12_18145 [Planctomycetaceae bacterium]|nr:hypothetical protein [Planctomycetaceae bacterium]
MRSLSIELEAPQQVSLKSAYLNHPEKTGSCVHLALTQKRAFGTVPEKVGYFGESAHVVAKKGGAKPLPPDKREIEVSRHRPEGSITTLND